MEPRIHLVPINAVDGVFLDRLGLCLEERFLLGAIVAPSLSIPPSALNQARRQLFLSALTSKALRAMHGTAGPLLVITEFDLYKTSRRFVFGDADERQGVAVVSLHRLRAEFYGEPADSNMLFQRTLKECVHELGHVFGLRHCYNVRCAMYYSNSIFETDNQMPHFCEACERRRSRTPS